MAIATRKSVRAWVPRWAGSPTTPTSPTTTRAPKSRAAIARAVEVGLREMDAKYEVELDRARAIERAISQAEAGDVVLIAGKGHEPYQLIGDQTLPFDDRIEARRALALRRKRGGPWRA